MATYFVHAMGTDFDDDGDGVMREYTYDDPFFIDADNDTEARRIATTRLGLGGWIREIRALTDTEAEIAW